MVFRIVQHSSRIDTALFEVTLEIEPAGYYLLPRLQHASFIATRLLISRILRNDPADFLAVEYPSVPTCPSTPCCRPSIKTLRICILYTDIVTPGSQLCIIICIHRRPIIQ